MSWFMENWDVLLTTALTVMGAASAVAAITPWKEDDLYVGYLVKVLNFFAANFGKAKNAKDA